MSTDHRVHVYTPANNLDGNLLRVILQNAGIEAWVVEDNSQIGAFIGGLMSNLHKPQLWVRRDDVDHARMFIAEFEQARSKRGQDLAEGTIHQPCEHCGAELTFSQSLAGTVQVCPECHQFIDVNGDSSGADEADWSDIDGS